MSLPFLLEIGTEEIPDWMIVPALNNLQDMFQGLLDQQVLGGRVTSVDATPRRLVLQADGLLERQADVEELVLGPATKAGAGAAAGFAKKMGTTPDQLGTEVTAKGEYFAFKKRTQGQATGAILARELPNLILKIQWPKTMVWSGKGTERFIRPIRWLVALLGDSVVPFEIGGVHSGNVTRGRRGLLPFTVTITDFSQKLKANGVILSADERRARIESGISVRVKPDPDLLHTLTYITEFPTPILGSFDRSYLDLPQEVLVTVMRHHQKYLSVEDADGKLAPHFIAVMNTDADPDGLVRQGNEKVLRARFNDARFFWDQDQKKALAARLEDLKAVTFQAKLGSYYEKTQRVVALTKELGGNERAALLCKCDLTTDMVKEFTDLQGVVGGLYARAQGEPEEVAQAIYDHYKPLSMEDEIPSTLRWPNSQLRRQMGHAGGMLQCRHGAHWIAETHSDFAAPHKALCGSSSKVRDQIRFPRHEPELSSSCVTASNTISAMSVVSLTTKSAPAWPPAGPIFIDLEARLKRVQGNPRHARLRTDRRQLQTHQKYPEAGALRRFNVPGSTSRTGPGA